MAALERNPATPTSRLPHRLATVLVCAVFPLIWVGGLVTSTESGMAVPDWPSTYGYNLFLYPWTTWYYGPMDIFVEHGHRLLGAVAGLISIGLVWSLWATRASTLARGLGVAAFLAILSQGIVGGLRVNLNERLLAMLHACTGPLAFGVCVAAWYYTGNRSGSAVEPGPAQAKVFRLALLTTCLAYFQIVLGAVVRHMPVTAAPQAFHGAVMFHLLMAGILTLHVVLLAVACFRAGQLRGGAGALIAMIAVQLTLGAGTWVVNFGIPQWVGSIATTPDFVVRTQSQAQVMITTAHVAVGSLILVTSLLLSLKAKRLTGSVFAAASFPAGLVLREALR